ncbi:Wadjet anti-phage system protein JetA family protein [Bradyrhizobium sp. CCBAU 53421]|uniref:Wadjet anti-phage system protein JetA family protein n=1 Tax=Bradyrhizobium sp. CCBAU 53421 TaxID=1325120 RepID=UPI001FEE19D3|nr:Wadjet anti-phage system protein JetA family protein [Bradyrhizobium sp. CCBAU 53421]
MFDRIETFRRQLEARVRNTIRYAERGAQGLVGRAGDLVRRLDALLREGGHEEATVEWTIEPLRSPWPEHHQAPARQLRRPVEARELAGPPSDPLYELRKRIRLECIARIAPRPEDVKRFLERQVPPFATKEARFMEIGTVDDFLAFDCARHYALTGDVPAQIAADFDAQPSLDTAPHDSEWLRCTNFVVRRSGTPAKGRAIHAWRI